MFSYHYNGVNIRTTHTEGLLLTWVGGWGHFHFVIFCYIPSFSEWSKYPLSVEYHVHIYETYNRSWAAMAPVIHECHLKKLTGILQAEEINEQSFSNPHPWTSMGWSRRCQCQSYDKFNCLKCQPFWCWNQNILGFPSQYQGCWCSGSLIHQIVNSHGTDSQTKESLSSMGRELSVKKSLKLLQLHLHSRLNIWLQWIGQRHDEKQVLGFGVTYNRGLTVVL